MSTQPHPVRVEVWDDLKRSRLTVFFRLILAIPHFIGVFLFTIGALFAAIANWFATLATGTPPQGLHAFLSRYVRYVTRVSAYVGLAAEPWPGFMEGSEEEPYPLEVRIDERTRQNRWKTLFRLPLALPALIVSSALGNSSSSSVGGRSGGATTVTANLGLSSLAAVLSWFYALAKGRAPRGLRDVTVWASGYSAQTWAYVLCLTDRYPYAGPLSHVQTAGAIEPTPGRPRLANHDDLRRSRVTTFFRLPLAVPHVVWLVLWSIAAYLAAIAAWVSGIALGRVPAPLARFLAAWVRYQAHVGAFLFLVGNPFPGFTGTAGSYPVDARVVPSDRQPRLTIAFRAILTVPALLISAAYSGALWTVGILGWFASLATGRMPSGLQEAGAVAVGYAAQANAYTVLVTHVYPHASPLAVLDLPAPPGVPEPPAPEPPAGVEDRPPAAGPAA